MDKQICRTKDSTLLYIYLVASVAWPVSILLLPTRFGLRRIRRIETCYSNASSPVLYS